MRKIIYIIFLIGSAVLVSFRGGNISYLLFYFALLIPILALTYSIYVYFRFKIVQEVPRNVVKAKEVPYRLILANEDFIPFTNITLHYFSDMVTIKEDKDIRNLCLLPHQIVRVDTKMYCKYRGTYEVGVKSVSVTDFLGLFTITYPLITQVRLTAMPRILPLELFRSKLQKKDPKNTLFSLSRLQELPDYELRPYRPGDQRKFIHWKNSAKAGELLVRKQMPEELFEIVIIADLSPIQGPTETRLQREDNIIEAIVAFVHDYYLKQIPVRVVYMDDKNDLRELLINARTGFEYFYEACATMAFSSSLPLEKVWEQYTARTANPYAAILITSSATDSLMRYIEEKSRISHEIELINTGELTI